MSKRFEVVETYERLKSYRRMYMAPKDGIELVILGRPGLAKTRTFTETLGTPDVDYVLIRGNQTAFEMYRRLHAGRNLPVLIDDVDDALVDSKKRTLLKEALESSETKRISWGSATAKLMDEHGNPIPTSFMTTSTCCVIGNKLTNRTEEHLSAVLSRAFCIQFTPTIHEVHRYVGTWFDDSEIYRFVGENLPLIVEIDIRDYVHALKFKRFGEDWKAMLRHRWVENQRLLPVLRILSDPTLSSTAQRVERFQQTTGGSRRTFMYLQAEIKVLRGKDAAVQPVNWSLDVEHRQTPCAESAGQATRPLVPCTVAPRRANPTSNHPINVVRHSEV